MHLLEERTIGRAYWIRAVSREGSDDRSYSINLPKKWCDRHRIDRFVAITEHPTEEDALVIRKIG